MNAEAGQVWGGLLASLTASGAYMRNQYEALIALPTGPTTTQTITIVPFNQLDASLRGGRAGRSGEGDARAPRGAGAG